MTPRRDGTPRLPAGSRKDRDRPYVLSVRATAEMKTLIREAASREGIAPSEWVRRRLREALALGDARRRARTRAPAEGPS